VRSYLLWAGLLGLALGIYWPGLHGEFIFDDIPNIVDNSALRITNLSPATLASSLTGLAAGPLGRPVAVMSFALTHYFFGLDAFAFKAINLLIHAANALLIAWLLKILLSSLTPDSLRGARDGLPIWCAGIWLVHPINVEPVLLAVQRMTLLGAFFLLLALAFHLKALALPIKDRTRWGRFGLAWLVFWPLSFFSKETGLLFPLYALAATGLLRTMDREKISAIASLRLNTWIMLSIALTAGLSMFFWLGQDWLKSAYAMRTFSPTERLLTEARVLWFYLAQILAPSYQAYGFFLDDIPLSSGLLRPWTTLASLFGLAGLVTAGVIFRRRHPVLSFSIAWFLLGHAMESTFLPLEIAHEYRNYLPSIGPILAVGFYASTALERIKLDHRTFTIGLVAVLPLLLLALFTWMRADQWRDALVAAQIEAMHHPRSARANHMAALTLFQAGQGDANDPIGGNLIRYHFEQSGAVDPAFKLGYLGLLTWACGSERPVDKQWVSALSKRLEHTPFGPRDRELPGDLLSLFTSMPHCLAQEDVLSLLNSASRNQLIGVSLRSLFLESAADYELLVSRNPASAINFYNQALAISPHNVFLRKKLEKMKLAP
jgi:hypothetical protein